MSRSRRGLTLVEVIVALVVLALAVPPLLLQVAGGIERQNRSDVQQNLARLASDRLWEIFTAHANPDAGYDEIDAASYPDETAPAGLTGYARSTTIREVAPTNYSTPLTGSGIKRFRIVVTGPGGESLVLESFVTDIPGAG